MSIIEYKRIYLFEKQKIGQQEENYDSIRNPSSEKGLENWRFSASATCFIWLLGKNKNWVTNKYATEVCSIDQST